MSTPVPTQRRIRLDPYPRGWYAVALSRELSVGSVLSEQLCGRPIVVVRATDGTVRVADAHCPHLGAHLGRGGRVDGDVLVCPFHGWRFGPDGRCTGMPYGQRVPAQSQLRMWPVREQDDVVLAWFEPASPATASLGPDSSGPDSSGPDWEVPRVAFGAASTATRARRWEIATHPQEILENGVDGPHFRNVHGMHLLEPEDGPSAAGPHLRITLRSNPTALVPDARAPQETPSAFNQVGFHGPGVTWSRMQTADAPLRVLSRVYVSPIDGERVAMRVLSNLLDERPDGAADAAALEAVADDVAVEVFRQFDQDVAIWEHKCYRERPALNELEQPVVAFRRWFRQFYPNSSRPPRRTVSRG